MQIQLKQAEIEAALKAYIVAQGISLQGKTVDITFIAKREKGGLVADLDIQDAGEIPGFTDADTDGPDTAAGKNAPALSVVSDPAFDPDVVPTQPAKSKAKAKAEKPDFAPAAEVKAEPAPPATKPAEPEPAPVVTKTTSLFGG